MESIPLTNRIMTLFSCVRLLCFGIMLCAPVISMAVEGSVDLNKTSEVVIDYQGSANLQGTQADLNDECCQAHEYQFTSTGDVHGAKAQLAKRTRIAGPRHWSDQTVAHDIP